MDNDVKFLIFKVPEQALGKVVQTGLDFRGFKAFIKGLFHTKPVAYIMIDPIPSSTAFRVSMPDIAGRLVVQADEAHRLHYI